MSFTGPYNMIMMKVGKVLFTQTRQKPIDKLCSCRSPAKARAVLSTHPQKLQLVELLSSLIGAAGLFAMIKILSRSQNYNALNGKNSN